MTRTKEKNKMKTRLQKRFQKLYKGKRLLAIQLDGFTHRLVYDDGTKTSEVEFESFSHCMPEGNWSKQSKEFFKDISNASYQNKATEYLYTLPENR